MSKPKPKPKSSEPRAPEPRGPELKTSTVLSRDKRRYQCLGCGWLSDGVWIPKCPSCSRYGTVARIK